MPEYDPVFRRALAAAVSDAEIDEEHALADSLDLCRRWDAGMGLVQAGIPLAPLVETRVAASVAGVHGAIRLLHQVRAAMEGLLTPEDWRRTWTGAGIHEFLDYLFASLIETRGGRFSGGDRDRFRGPAGPGELEAPLDGLSPVAVPALSGPAGGVLLIASTERYLNPLLPVIAPLRERVNVTLLAPRASREWPIRRRLPEDLPVVAVEDLYSAEAEAVLARWQRRGRQVWEREWERLRERFHVDGVSLLEMLDGGVEAVLTRFLPHAAAYVEMAHRLFATARPAVVLTAKLTRLVESAFFAVAERRGSRRVVLPHGQLAPFPNHFFVQGQFASADRVCVWGEYYLQTLSRHLGKDLGRKAVVTGNPAWDRLVRADGGLPPRAPLRARAAQILPAPPEAVWVTYLSEWISVRQYPAVLAAVAAIPNVYLIVKVHPEEQVEWYRERILPSLAERTAVLQAHPDLDLHSLLRASDLSITYQSTTGLESILAGTPFVSVALDPGLCRKFPSSDWSAHGIPVAKTLPELFETLQCLTADAEARSYLLEQERAGIRPFVRNSDGASAVAAVVAEILRCREDAEKDRIRN